MKPLHAPRTTHPISRFIVILVVLLAAYLRLNHLEWTEFKLDEAHISQLAYDMARHGQFAATSIGSSVGVANLPLAVWLLAIPYAVSADPIVATAFLALTNVLAVALSYWLAQRMFKNSLAAALAALLFAVAPWAVIFSRKLWANDFLPLFVMLWACSGWLAFVESKSRALMVHAVALVAAIMLHYSAAMLILVSALWGLAFLRRIRWKYVIVAGLLGAALLLPFLIADGLQGWQNVTRLFAMSQQSATLDAQAIDYATLMTTGRDIHSLAGPQEFENYRAEVFGLDLAPIGVGALVVVSLLIAVIDLIAAVRRRAWTDRSAASWLIATWLLIPIASQLSHRTALYPHYFIPLFPAAFLSVGNLVAHLPRRGQWLIGGVVVLIAAMQANQVLALQGFVAQRPTPGGAGIPIGYYETIVRDAQQARSARGAAEIIINTRGVDPAVDEYPAIFAFLLNEVPHRFVDATQAARVFPKETNIQIDFLPDQPMPRPIAEREPIGHVALRIGEQAADIYVVAPYASIHFGSSMTPLARWANGVGVLWLNARDLRRGTTTTLEVYVRVDNVPPPAIYQWTNQVFDEQGKRWAQVDAGGYPASYWRSGDIIGYEFGLVLPPDLPYGTYLWRLGQYTLPDVVTVPVIDVAGLPQSDAFEFHLLVEP